MPTPAPDPEARVAEMIAVVKAAAEVGVRHVVYPGAAEVEGLDFPLLSSHTRVYEAIEQRGMQGTHLRNGIYAEVVAGEVAGAIAAGELAAPVNGARVAPGFGPLTAAKLVGEIAGANRFATDAKLARAARLAPIPVSSGKTNRHRLDRGGNRQVNAAIHRVAVTRARCDPETRAYIARKTAEGKTTREAVRCLKRHLARRIWHLLQTAPPVLGTPPSPSTS